MTQEFKELARHAAHKTAPENFEVANVNEAFVAELSKYCSSIPQFMKNRYDLYEIIMENADDVAPKKVIDALGAFAEIKQVKQGQKAIFKIGLKASKLRARKFFTQVGLAGVYESFRLDQHTVEIPAHAVGGAVTVDFERMLDGVETLSDVMEVIVEGLSDSIFLEVQKALKAAYTNMGANNKVSGNTFSAADMFKLCRIVSSYGSAVIFAPPEFIAAMGPDQIGPQAYRAQYATDDIDSIHNTGYIQLFRGFPVVQIPQSYTDMDNNTTWIDPQIAYIMPTGGEKVVKVVLEGNTQMYDWKNKDNSMEIQVYKKIGCGVLHFNNWAIYQNTSITQTMYNPYPGL